jgi:hypothetical protein
MEVINYKNIDVEKITLHSNNGKYYVRYDKHFLFIKLPKTPIITNITKLDTGKYKIKICVDKVHGSKSNVFFDKLKLLDEKLVYLFDIIGIHKLNILEKVDDKYYLNLIIYRNEEDSNYTKFYDKLGTDLKYKNYKSLLEKGRIISSIIYINCIDFNNEFPIVNINLLESIIFDELLYNKHKVNLSFLNI